MRNLLGLLAAAAGAAATMYYFDPDMGRRRRAMLRQRLVGVSNDAQGALAGRAKYAAGKIDGLLATHSLGGETRTQPQSDAQLRDRVRSRLGRLVSHPGGIEVQVEDGAVRLSGNVLSGELDGLLTQVRDMAGVKRVINGMTSHDNPHAMVQPGAAGAKVSAEEEARAHPT